MIHKTGSITGGMSESMESRAAKLKFLHLCLFQVSSCVSRWDDERLVCLRRQKAKVESDLGRLPSVRDLQLEEMRQRAELERLANRKQCIRQEEQTCAAQTNEKQSEIAKGEHAIQKLDPEIVALKNEIAQRSASIQRIKDQIDVVADRHFVSVCVCSVLDVVC